MQAALTAAVIPFQIVVGGRGPGGAYILRASASGRNAEATLDLPALPDDPDSLGAALGAALFPPPLRQLLLDVARGADEAGARVQLQLQVAPPELAALPWEWATLGRAEPWRPAIRDDYALVRVSRGASPRPPLTVAGPLRLLIACAPGCDAAAASLGHALAEPVRAGLLVADLLRDTTPADLAAALDEEPCHLLHIVAPVEEGAHGGGPRLRLGRGVDGAGLAGLLAEFPGLRLVTLAGPGEPGLGATLAARLHGDVGLASLALSGLEHEQAASFCAACYGGLAAGDAADLAATDGRATLAGAGAPWGQVRLHLSPGGEQLFRLRPAPPEGLTRGHGGTGARGRGETMSTAKPPRPPQSERHERSPRAAGRRARPERPRAQPRTPVAGLPWPALRLPELPAAMRRPLAQFAVQSTTVGAPARRAPAEPRRGPLVSPKLIALLAAVVVLGLMVSRVMPRSSEAAAPPAPAEAPMGIPVPTLIPTLQAQVAAGIASLGQGGPLSVPEPQSYVTYLVAEGDSLESIAGRAGSDALAIAATNFLSPLEPLRPGRPLVVPIYREGEALPPAPVVNRGSPERPQVALTFDIEIDDVTLYSILDTLRDRGLKGTFFVTGSWVQRYPEAARRIVADGHEIANHSLSHPSFSTIGADGAIGELAETERIVREVTGASTRPYFRFPYGDQPDTMVNLVGSQGYAAYFWSADDYGIPSWIAQVTANPSEGYGGILLMHGRQSTADALPGWLDQLQAAGLQPTSLGEVLR